MPSQQQTAHPNALTACPMVVLANAFANAVIGGGVFKQLNFTDVQLHSLSGAQSVIYRAERPHPEPFLADCDHETLALKVLGLRPPIDFEKEQRNIAIAKQIARLDRDGPRSKHLAKVFGGYTGNWRHGEATFPVVGLLGEFFPEGDLFQWRQRVDLPPTRETIARLVLDVATALECLHDSGFVHHDVKPANVFVTHDPNRIAGAAENVPRAILGDFGSTRTINEENTGAPTEIFAPRLWMEEQGNPRFDVTSLAYLTAFLIMGRFSIKDRKEGRMDPEFFVDQRCDERRGWVTGVDDDWLMAVGNLISDSTGDIENRPTARGFLEQFTEICEASLTDVPPCDEQSSADRGATALGNDTEIGARIDGLPDYSPPPTPAPDRQPARWGKAVILVGGILVAVLGVTAGLWWSWHPIEPVVPVDPAVSGNSIANTTATPITPTLPIEKCWMTPTKTPVRDPLSDGKLEWIWLDNAGKTASYRWVYDPEKGILAEDGREWLPAFTFFDADAGPVKLYPIPHGAVRAQGHEWDCWLWDDGRIPHRMIAGRHPRPIARIDGQLIEDGKRLNLRFFFEDDDFEDFDFAR